MSKGLWIMCVAAFGLATIAGQVFAKGGAVSAGGAAGSARALGLGRPIPPALLHHHRRPGYPYGGVVVAAPAIASGSAGPAPAPVITVALKCRPSVEIKVVPSEEFGTREIMIRRCF